MTAALWVAYIVGAAVLALFLGGMLSAAFENRQEKRATGTVTRPGWQIRREKPCYCCEGYVCTYCTPSVAGPERVIRRRSL